MKMNCLNFWFIQIIIVPLHAIRMGSLRPPEEFAVLFVCVCFI